MVEALDCFSPLRETARSSPAQVPALGDSVSTRYAASNPCRPRWAATWAYEGLSRKYGEGSRNGLRPVPLIQDAS
eukprot:709587-Pyramimonas_sp.AAC.1